MAGISFFLYGLVAGYLLVRLQRLKRDGQEPSRTLWAIAWIMMVVSFALAALSIGWMGWVELKGGTESLDRS